MLATRIIPCLDIKDGRIVKGVQFVNLRDAGDPIQVAKHYAEKGADELCFLDITASAQKRSIVSKLVSQVANEIFIPFTVGGGLRTLEDIDHILHSGADKISLNTAAFQNPRLITEAANRFGSQCVVSAIDARRHPPETPHLEMPPKTNTNLQFEVYLHGGRTPTGKDTVAWAKEVADRGAGEILLTSMDRDGTGKGYDLELIKAVRQAVPLPVIASGGVGKLEHLVDAVKIGLADAVLAASIFHFGDYTIEQAKEMMLKHNLAVRC